ncbi:MAG: hypothetical protein Athens101410_789 [Parcubacteria group bacterium Athens1014_10]|nr:MAG: hypothetical protein Athens101410_789 [Parcubacteria group bacterium Athens1014_10]
MVEMNKEKFKNAVLYFAQNAGDVGWSTVGKKKLAKLFYFLDFTVYELKQKSVSNIVYKKENFGPMPLFYQSLIELKKQAIIDIKKPDKNWLGLERIVAKQEPDLNVFDENEKLYLKQISEKYRSASAAELERIAKSEPPYKMVKYGEEIPYYLAFYRNTFGEMDLNDKNTDS